MRHLSFHVVAIELAGHRAGLKAGNVADEHLPFCGVVHGQPRQVIRRFERLHAIVGRT